MKTYFREAFLPFILTFVLTIFYAFIVMIANGNAFPYAVQLAATGTLGGAGLPLLVWLITISIIYKKLTNNSKRKYGVHLLVTFIISTIWLAFMGLSAMGDTGGWAGLIFAIMFMFTMAFLLANLTVETALYFLRRKSPNSNKTSDNTKTVSN